jgi:translation initiation factor 2B subunit (eIF-2B alpha/beta/delta family)
MLTLQIMQQLQDLNELVASIKDDLTSGAAEIALRAIAILQNVFEEGKNLPPDKLKAKLAEVCAALVACQPAMAPVFQLCNRVLLAVTSAVNTAQIIEQGNQCLSEFETHLCASAEQIANYAFELIPYGELVFAYSFSSTVLSTLLHARTNGKVFKVVCTESRPSMEGRKLAAQLAAGGIEVVHTFDTAAALVLSECAIAFMGADVISKSGLVNKVGSFMLACTCKELGVPLFSLAGTEKIVSQERLLEFEKHERPGYEVWDTTAQGIQVLNLQFELVPFSMISGLVTEEGVLRQSDIDRYLKNWKVHEALL